MPSKKYKTPENSWFAETWFVLVVFCLLGIVAAVVYLGRIAPNEKRTEEIAVRTSSEATEGTLPPPAATLPPSEPTTTPEATPLHEPKPTAPPVSFAEAPPTHTPSASKPSGPPLDPAWRIYDDLASSGDGQWRQQLDTLLKPIGNAKVQVVTKEKPPYIQLNGTYEVVPPTAEGGTTRLRMTYVEQLRLGFWRGKEGVLVEYVKNEGTLQAFNFPRTPGKSLHDAIKQRVPEKPSHTIIDSDQGLWRRAFSDGPIEVRYENGALLICRGDLLFLTLPMPEPPEHFLLDTKCRLKSAEHCRLPPLNIEERAKKLIFRDEKIAPKDLEWKLETEWLADKVTLRSDGDAMVFSSKADKSAREDNWIALATLPYGSGSEITMRIDSATVGTGVLLVSPTDFHRRLQFRIGQHQDLRIFCDGPESRNSVNWFYKKGLVVGEKFWVRLITNFNAIQIDVSNNGKTWIPASAWDQNSTELVKPATHIGVIGRGFREKGEIRVGEIQVRRFGGLEQLVDAKLVERASQAFKALTTKTKYWKSQLELLLAACPKDVAPRDWGLASRLVILQHSPTHCRMFAADLLRDAMLGVKDWKRLEPALLEFPRRLFFTGSFDWSTLSRLYCEVAQDYWSDPQLRQRLPDLLDVWYLQESSFNNTDKYASDSRLPAPIDLTRLAFYALLERGDWERLFLAALREKYLFPFEKKHSIRPLNLAPWMQSRALQHWSLPQKEVASELDLEKDEKVVAKTFARHPLDAKSLSKNQRFLCAEIEKGILAKNWAGVAKLLTLAPLAEVTSTFVPEGDLLVPLSKVLMDWIDAHPELITALQAKEQIGRLWLHRGIRESDLPLIEAVIVQFHRTQVSREALAHLAGRALSEQQFRTAANYYGRLVILADEASKQQWEAHQRLASAFLGKKTGKPVTKPVTFNECILQPNQFEQMVSQIIKKKEASAAVAKPASERFVSTAKSYVQTHRHTLNLPVKGRTSRETNTQAIEPLNFGWAAEGDSLYIHTPQQLVGYNMANGSVAFTHRGSEVKHVLNTSSSPRPLLLNNSPNMLLPFWLGEYTSPLCLNKTNGTVVWNTLPKVHSFVLGEPLLCDGVLMTFCIEGSESLNLSTVGELVLRRTDPNDGTLLSRRSLVNIELTDALFQMGRPTRYEDLLVVRIGAGVLCCDLCGEIKWIRKLPFMSRHIEKNQYRRYTSGNLHTAGDRVIIDAPGTYTIECRDIRTGKLHWSRMEPDLTNIVGVEGNRVIFTTEKVVEALDLESGKLAWRVRCDDPNRKTLLTQEGRVLVVDPRIHSGGNELEINCFQASDGTPLEPLKVKKNSLKHIERMITDGRRIILFEKPYDGSNQRLNMTVLEPEK